MAPGPKYLVTPWGQLWAAAESPPPVPAKSSCPHVSAKKSTPAAVSSCHSTCPRSGLKKNLPLSCGSHQPEVIASAVPLLARVHLGCPTSFPSGGARRVCFPFAAGQPLGLPKASLKINVRCVHPICSCNQCIFLAGKSIIICSTLLHTLVFCLRL